MSNYTTFRVIKIIDEYSIVINGGINDDITLGEDIEIFIEGDEIKYEGEVLGTLDFVKAKLEVTEVYPKFAVCKNIVEEKEYHPTSFQKTLGASLSAFNELGGRTVVKTVEKKINIDETEATGRKTGDGIIRIGDLARLEISE